MLWIFQVSFICQILQFFPSFVKLFVDLFKVGVFCRVFGLVLGKLFLCQFKLLLNQGIQFCKFSVFTMLILFSALAFAFYFSDRGVELG